MSVYTTMAWRRTEILLRTKSTQGSKGSSASDA